MTGFPVFSAPDMALTDQQQKQQEALESLQNQVETMQQDEAEREQRAFYNQ
jgi:hypothetical protein